MSTGDYLQDKFPDMKPTTSAPTLHTINGVGFMAYGSRDFDHETGTYVKTYFFCVLFIPLVALKAYRVADAPSGWYFLGSVPLSGLARAWNLLLLLGAVVGAGVLVWANRPEYQRQLAEAEQLAATGQFEQAAEKFRIVIEKYPSQAADTLQSFNAFLDGPLAQAKLEEAAPAWHIAVQLQQKHPQALSNVFERAWAQAKKAAETEPRGAWKVLQAVAPLAPHPKELADFQVQILEAHVARQPDDLDAVSDLALSHEANQDFDRCVKLLAPHANTLGDREGARILGQIYTGRGMFVEAHALLDTYAAERLKLLHGAEERLNEAVKSCDSRTLADLKSGRAAGFDFTRYKTLGKEAQDKMVQDHLDARLKEDLSYRTALESMRRAGKVVPVALDLGIVLLRRGQGADATAEQRKDDLEKAEKTFLAIRGLAGNTDEFRLYLGQVYYWMGKHDQGKKLFDELLAAHHRKTETLVAVGGLLREVGAVSEACVLTEEAYEKEGDLRKKFQAAALRAVMSIEIDDKIVWHQRADPADRQNQASLQDILGEKAFQQGQEQEAGKHFDEALRIYASLPESATTLNNGALVHLHIFRHTGERKSFSQATSMLEKAATVKAGDSILLSNIASNVMSEALWDVVEQDMDLKVLKRAGGLDLLRFLYRDRAGRDKIVERLRAHAGLARARAQLEQVLILSPRNPMAYGMLDALALFSRDLDAVIGLHRRLQEVEIDLRDFDRIAREDFAGKNDERLLKELAGTVKRQEENVRAVRKLGGPTLAAAISTLVTGKQGLESLGEEVDATALIALAEEGDKAASSSGSQATLVQTLLFRAHKALAKQEPAYAALATQTRRSLHPSHVMAFALSQPGPLQKACRAQPDVERAVELVAQQFERFPDEANEWGWALLRSARPEHAAHIAKATINDEIGKLDRAIVDKCSALNGGNILRAFWYLQMTGEDEQAEALLRRGAEKGIPLPIGKQ